MNTTTYEDIATFLVSMAIPATEAKVIAVGVTTIRDIEANYAVIDKIGTSYTGGPVLNLTEWEIGLEGVTDIQLAFNVSGLLDVATVKAEKTHFEKVLSEFASVLAIQTDESHSDFHNVSFTAGHLDVLVESHPLDSQFTINYMSADFQKARSAAQSLYG